MTHVWSPFVLEFTLTVPEIREQVRLEEPRFFRFFPMRVMAALLLVGTAWMWAGGFGSLWLYLMWLMFALLLLVPDGWFLQLTGSLFRSSMPQLRYRITVDEDGLTTEDFTDGDPPQIQHFNWNRFTESGAAQETELFFRLQYPTRPNRLPNCNLFIPKRALASESEIDRFRSLVREKLGEHFSRPPRSAVRGAGCH